MGVLSTVWRQLASVFECVYASEDYAAVWCGMRSREICGAFFSADFCVDLLKTTTVGKSVAALKKAADAKLVMAAKGLVARWKQMVRDADAASS